MPQIRAPLLLLVTALAVPVGAQRPDPANVLEMPFGGELTRGAPGCAVGATGDLRSLPTWANGIADLTTGRPLTPRSIFYAGSVSKQFVAMSVALLAERGVLSFEDDVHRWIEELPDYPKPVTLRHLLNHTSGIRDYLGLASASGRDWSDNFSNSDAMAIVVGDTEVSSPAGTEYRYSNSGYLLLAEVVARASGITLSQFVSREILRPLDMTDSHFHDDLSHVIEGLALGYRGTDDSWQAWPLNFAAVGSGGLYTSARDLARWSHNLFDNRIGSGQALIDTMLTRGVLNNGDTLSYGMGLRHATYRGLPMWGHTGALAAYRAAVFQFPTERVGIVMLCNYDSANTALITQGVADRLLKGRFKEEAPARP